MKRGRGINNRKTVNRTWLYQRRCGLGLTCKFLRFFHSLKIIYFYGLISISRESIRSAISAPGKRKGCEKEDVWRGGETWERRVTLGLGRCLKCNRRGGGGGGAHLRIQVSRLWCDGLQCIVDGGSTWSDSISKWKRVNHLSFTSVRAWEGG